MSKRNVSFTKPEEPAFLKRLKTEAGYKEACDITTKAEAHSTGPEDHSGEESEMPQVVVLRAGDLTKEEADIQLAKIAKEESEKPADLNQRIIFKPKPKDNGDPKPVQKTKKDPRKSTKPKRLLAFRDFNEDHDEN